jgi:peptidoglycan/xylan/chitin deacetylase (PgdA/CDA1 family)
MTILRTLYHSVDFLLRGTKNSIFNRLNPPVVILGYHRVSTLHTDPQLLAVAPENFRQQLEVIRQYPVLRFEDQWGAVRKPSIVITFDDGYADNLLEALPILEDFNMPATFFMTTGKIGSLEEFWWDELERLILLPEQLPSECTLVSRKGDNFSWPLRTMSDRLDLYEAVHSLIHNSGNPKECADLLDQLRSWCGVTATGRVTHLPLNHSQLTALAKHPLVTIGAHGMSHLPFSRLLPDEQRQEIIGSRDLLQGWLGKDVPVFSYPFGSRKDFTPETVKYVQHAGFCKAAANYPGQWHSGTDAYSIPRHLVRNWDGETFSERLRKFWVV